MCLFIPIFNWTFLFIIQNKYETLNLNDIDRCLPINLNLS